MTQYDGPCQLRRKHAGRCRAAAAPPGSTAVRRSWAEGAKLGFRECVVDWAQWVMLRASLVSEADPAQDSLRFYFLGTEWRRRVEHVGTKPAYDPEAPLIL